VVIIGGKKGSRKKSRGNRVGSGEKRVAPERPLADTVWNSPLGGKRRDKTTEGVKIEFAPQKESPRQA